MAATASTYVHYTSTVSKISILNIPPNFQFALNLMLGEQRQLPKDLTRSPGPCLPPGCAFKRTQGLPCRHVIHRHLQDGEPLAKTDIDPHWWWDRSFTAVGHEQRPLPPLLMPQVIRPTGRPRGALNIEHIARGTRRDPSLFERVEEQERAEGPADRTEAPPSTAPARLARTPADAVSGPAEPADTYECHGYA